MKARLFQYKALTPEGQVIEKEWLGESPNLLTKELQQHHLHPLSIHCKWWLPTPRLLSPTESQTLCFHLGHLIHAGVPLLDALTDLSPSLGKKRPTPLETLALFIREQVGQGRSLSEALHLSRRAPPILSNLIHAGEQSGELATMLLRLHTHFEWQIQQKTMLQHALRYPLLVSAVLACSIGFLVTVLLPQLRPFLLSLPPPLPLSTRILLWLNDFALPAGLGLLTAITSISIGLHLLAQQSQRARLRIAAWVLHFPVLGTLRLADERARLSSTLGLLYQAGIPLLDALSLTQAVLHNTFLKHLLSQGQQRLEQGMTLSQALDNPLLFSPLMRQMLRAGEKSGALDTALKEAAKFHQHEVDTMAKRLQSLIEPLLTLFLGVLLGGVLHAVLMPLYGSFQRIG